MTGPSDRQRPSPLLLPSHDICAVVLLKGQGAARCMSPSTRLCVKPPCDQCDLKSAAEGVGTAGGGVGRSSATLERFDSRLTPALGRGLSGNRGAPAVTASALLTKERALP